MVCYSEIQSKRVCYSDYEMRLVIPNLYMKMVKYSKSIIRFDIPSFRKGLIFQIFQKYSKMVHLVISFFFFFFENDKGLLFQICMFHCFSIESTEQYDSCQFYYHVAAQGVATCISGWISSP